MALTVVEAWAEVAAGRATLLDLRSTPERAEGGPAGALHLPLWDVDDRGAWLPSAAFVPGAQALAAQGRPLLLICREGQRSALASSLLQTAGIACDDVPGGTHGGAAPGALGLGWIAAGLPWRGPGPSPG